MASITKLLLSVLAVIFLYGCVENNDDAKSAIKRPYAGTFKMASREIQLKVESLLKDKGVAFHKENNGSILYSLYDYHHVQYAQRQALGRITEPWTFESSPPMHAEHKSLLIEALNKHEIWFQIDTGSNGDEVIMWRGVDGLKVDLIERDVMFILHGLDPPK